MLQEELQRERTAEEREQAIKDEKKFLKEKGRFGLKPEECVFADDKTENVEAARAYGMHAILFKSAVQYEAGLNAIIRQQDTYGHLPAPLEGRVRQAVDNFMQGYGCCQSVVAAFADLYGLDETMAKRIAAARYVSAAPRITLYPASLYWRASLPIVVVLPTPFTPTTIMT